jgi:formylmethanofuran dehydrogenase subunit B
VDHVTVASQIIVDNVACTVCACVCDDLSLTVQHDRIVRAERACSLSEPWFALQNGNSAPFAQRGSQPLDRDEAIAEAVAMLRAARNPLIYGLSRSSTEGQRAAVALADFLGANIDTTASEGHAPSLLALQESGESTCSLGEVRHRADLVIFWGSNPVVSHPRHLERYALWPKGNRLPNGRVDRTLVVVDTERTATAELADLFLPVPADRDFEALWTLRLLLQGREPAEGVDTGLPLEQLRDLAERMKRCQYGVVFFGYGLARQPLGNRVVEALLRLTMELNRFTRFQARRMRVLGDVSGADNVLCWQTGYPFSVNLSRGYPRYNPGEYSASDLLARGETDLVLFVGSDRVDYFPVAAQARLSQIPTILLDHAGAEPLWTPTLRFTTAVYGVHRAGTAYRMDDVPIPLRPVLTSPYPSDGEILRELLAALQANGERGDVSPPGD